MVEPRHHLDDLAGNPQAAFLWLIRIGIATDMDDHRLVTRLGEFLLQQPCSIGFEEQLALKI